MSATPQSADSGWDLEIQPNESWRSNFSLAKIRAYKDLLLLLVRRDVVAMYKQTVLGPVWFFIEPLFTTLVYIVIFGQIAKLGTGGVPQVLFYLSGLIMWNYFATNLVAASNTFIQNQALFSKVYFPRIIVPLSVTLSNGLKFFIQFALFLVFYLYYMFTGVVQPTVYILLFPVLVVIMAGLGLAGGMLVSAMTTRYKDLAVLLRFSIQLFRYVSTVIFPLAMLSPKFKILILSNPMSSLIEVFRVGCFSTITPDPWLWYGLGYSALFVTVLMVLGIAVFHKVEKKFIDTV